MQSDVPLCGIEKSLLFRNLQDDHFLPVGNMVNHWVLGKFKFVTLALSPVSHLPGNCL